MTFKNMKKIVLILQILCTLIPILIKIYFKFNVITLKIHKIVTLKNCCYSLCENHDHDLISNFSEMKTKIIHMNNYIITHKLHVS